MKALKSEKGKWKMQNTLLVANNSQGVVAVGVPQMSVADLVIGLLKEESQTPQIGVVQLNNESRTGIKEVDTIIDDMFKIVHSETKNAIMVEGTVTVTRISPIHYTIDVEFNSFGIVGNGFEVNEGKMSALVEIK
jgi:hypothetical protein